MTSGIYMIRNKINDKIYIGQAINVENRLNNHRLELRNDRHVNYFLQKDFNEYKEESFIFEKIHECDEEFLNPMEKYFIEKYNTTHNGYNIMNGNSNINRKVKEKMKREAILAERKKKEEEERNKIKEEIDGLTSIDIYIDEATCIDFKLCVELQCVINKYIADNVDSDINIHKLTTNTLNGLEYLESCLHENISRDVEEKIYIKTMEILKKYSDYLEFYDGEVLYNFDELTPFISANYKDDKRCKDIIINLIPNK